MSALKASELWKPLLLLRGLLAHGILLYVLTEKRWRVDYGLFPGRTILAVPYTAKDQPSPRADFAHPDVAILLTCLSYYYQGLSDEQLRCAFNTLLRQENADVEYGHWIADLKLKSHTSPNVNILSSLSNINPDDPLQRHELLHQHFSRNKATIDFYLNQHVFPQAAKHFTHKISTSAWDLAARTHHTTVGFSGTNDNQYLLPTAIKQCDPVEQSSLNAKVLSYLLLPENNQYAELSVSRTSLSSQPGAQANSTAAATVNCPLSGRQILDLIMQQPEDREVRVLLDVGAQLMDMDNIEVAQTWLQALPVEKAAGVVFFTQRDDLVILDREGLVLQFFTSPLSQQLHQCLVYLDESHTRGTDLKLPIGYRAAVTLGPKVTKDRLLQACMRMRQLGAGQSVMFLAPPEIHRAIIRAMHDAGETRTTIGSIDVIRWCQLETIRSIEHYLPQWFQQGLSYGRRSASWKQLLAAPKVDEAQTSFEAAWLERDSQSLEELYGDSAQAMPFDPLNLAPDGLLDRMSICGVRIEHTRTLEEEQEREISNEMEHERQLERRRPAPRQHEIHPHVVELVRTGKLIHSSDAFQPVFTDENCNVLQTIDFARTLANEATTTLWQGPVHWVLSSRRKHYTLFLLSSFEANSLLEEIRKSSLVHLHVYFPRATKFVESVDDLRFHVIPPLPPTWSPPPRSTMLQLNLYAGQLFMSSYSDYEFLGTSLGLNTPQIMELDPRPPIQPDGFITPEDRVGEMRIVCQYKTSPLVWLKDHLAQRRRGTDFTGTHLGKITRGRLLVAKDDF